MNFLFFIIFSFIVFFAVFIGGKKYRITTLYALAIGGVVNSNFFHSTNYPIDCFGLNFGIDSIIYTLFIFCVLLMLIKVNKKEAYILAASSIVAIVFAAVMQLVADLLSNGSSLSCWTAFINFMISAFASLIAIFIMIEVIERLKPKMNSYWLLIIGTVIATLVNSCIYYPLSMLVNGTPNNILELLFTSLCGKTIALLCSLIVMLVMNFYDKKQENKLEKNKE